LVNFAFTEIIISLYEGLNFRRQKKIDSHVRLASCSNYEA